MRCECDGDGDGDGDGDVVLLVSSSFYNEFCLYSGRFRYLILKNQRRMSKNPFVFAVCSLRW